MNEKRRIARLEQTRDLQDTDVCANCHYWEPTADDNGECRLEPPKVYVIPMTGIPPGIQAINPYPVTVGTMAQTAFPITKAEQWCGCWVALGKVPTVEA